jgi:hypothetical protein
MKRWDCSTRIFLPVSLRVSTAASTSFSLPASQRTSSFLEEIGGAAKQSDLAGADQRNGPFRNLDDSGPPTGAAVRVFPRFSALQNPRWTVFIEIAGEPLFVIGPTTELSDDLAEILRRAIVPDADTPADDGIRTPSSRATNRPKTRNDAWHRGATETKNKV